MKNRVQLVAAAVAAFLLSSSMASAVTVSMFNQCGEPVTNWKAGDVLTLVIDGASKPTTVDVIWNLSGAGRSRTITRTNVYPGRASNVRVDARRVQKTSSRISGSNMVGITAKTRSSIKTFRRNERRSSSC